MKISILYTTNKLNSNHIQYLADAKSGMMYQSFNDNFNELCNKILPNISHFIETTLNSLSYQTFKDFEIIISHRYPEDIPIEILKKYDFPIKLVKEKHSIWHDLGNYNTVANNKNTAIIYSSGELLFHIDDFTLFNNHILGEAWELYQEKKYLTSRTYRCIEYNPLKYFENKQWNIGPLKIANQKNGWYGEEKPLNLSIDVENPEISMNAFWTCGATVSRDEILEIGGYDEVWDGSLCGLDMDAGDRLSKISKFKRVASENYIYEINDFANKTMIRNDVIFRQICKQSLPIVRHIKANSWKPTISQMKSYEQYHKTHEVDLDINWNKFIDVPFIDLNDMYEKKNCSEVIYSNE